MDGASNRLLSALRRLRALDADQPSLGRQLLDIVAEATGATHVMLRRGGAEDVTVGERAPRSDDVARLSRALPSRSGTTRIELERPAARPFDEGDVAAVEILGGEVVLCLEQARAEVEAGRLRRQIELLRAVSRTSDGAAQPFDVADRAASELLRARAGAHVLVHVLVDDHLELVARRTDTGSGLADAPDWIRVLPLDGPTAMAVAARSRRTLSRPLRDVGEPRRAALEAMGVRHLLVVPLSHDDVLLGTLTVAHLHDEPWDAESMRLLEGIATQLGVEMARARLLEAERRRADDLGLINELGSLVAKHLELRGVLSTAASALARVLEVASVHVILADDSRESLEGVACTGDVVSDVAFSLGASHAITHAFRTLAPVVIDDAETDARTNKELVARAGTRSMAIVPLVAQGAAIGVIGLVETRHSRRFTESEVARVVAVANVIAPAVTNAKVFEDLRRSYEALAKAQAELVTHERLAALGELSAVIAHEVRNPVAIIFNSLSELRRLAPPPPDARLLLGIVEEEATRLNRIVGDLLDFVRPYDAHPRQMQVDAIVRGAVDAARRATPERNVEVLTEARLPGDELSLDGTMLQQALLNLIVNAIHATPDGRTVTVRTDVRCEAHGQHLRCEIVDEGPGIDEATRARMFQPFFTTKATGTGLGLAIVRRLADALGGTVEAGSAPAGGAVFTLAVPLPVPPRLGPDGAGGTGPA